jgi:RNA polymerase sigma factor for flagellar operon FliA
MHDDDGISKQDMELVYRIAGSLARRLPRHIERRELVGLGSLALVEARRRFDPTRGIAFAAFAATRIRGAMIDGLRRDDLLSRRERTQLRSDMDARPASVQIELDESVLPGDDDPVDERLARKQALLRVRDALGALTSREREVVERHFYEEEPLRSIGERLGVTESRVCQIAGGAVARLRHLIAGGSQ